MDRTVLVGLLQVVGISLVPVALLVGLGRAPRAWAWCARVVGPRLPRRRRPEAPTGPPLEKLAADLRRLHPDVHHPRPGTRMAKQQGVQLAYDERLAAAGTALEVPTSLLSLPLYGLEREAERMRLEHALTAAGLVWQPRPSPGQDLPQ
ncbi:hypothetical protein ASG49_01695 [Marmoricola sp. Leaf446]|uniref:hypothetical protein n=1 Tax=Marmoricola sp. Leaf446 TaxID=1736379 RepID=UPI0006F7DACD|nr:hypothetical protein [Marmoricola sp. Leaf446]KQT93722.1 hypothetical protein ASG49_01695 [Marmoricola sp. Leaf446]